MTFIDFFKNSYSEFFPTETAIAMKENHNNVSFDNYKEFRFSFDCVWSERRHWYIRNGYKNSFYGLILMIV